jgi:hypothetical protein
VQVGRVREPAQLGQRGDRARVVLLGDGLLGLVDRVAGLGVLDGADARLEIEGIDAELVGEPGDRVRRGPRPPTLDLAQVLLREALAGQ